MQVSMIHKIKRRLDWYRVKLTINNPIVGRAIGLAGNKVRLDGLTYSVDSPQITAGQKCTIAFGYHETEERLLIRRWLPKNLPLIELGGGLGIVSCLANRRLADPEKHIVVEANPEMLAVLERNRGLNRCKFTVINKAIAYGREKIELKVSSNFVASSMVRDVGDRIVTVETTNVSSLMKEAGFEQAGIICDIEGAEADIIKRELPMLSPKIRFFMAEMHPEILGWSVVNELLKNMVDLGFVLKEKLGNSVFFSRD